jgi:hypothetical protein
MMETFPDEAIPVIRWLVSSGTRYRKFW